MDAIGAHAETAGPRVGPRLRTLMRQGVWFAVVGVLATALNSLLYLLLRQWSEVLTANVLALALSTLASSEANRLLTFAGISTTRASLDTQSVLVFLFYCFYNSLALGALHLVAPGATPQTEAVVLFVVSGLGGIGRFVLLRYWVFTGHRARSTGEATEQQPSEQVQRRHCRVCLRAVLRHRSASGTYPTWQDAGVHPTRQRQD